MLIKFGINQSKHFHKVNTFLSVLQVLVNRAKSEIDIIMPGYTHLQRAQPVRWSHFLLRL